MVLSAVIAAVAASVAANAPRTVARVSSFHDSPMLAPSRSHAASRIAIARRRAAMPATSASASAPQTSAIRRLRTPIRPRSSASSSASIEG